jgi:autotransporter-associated beta strand protein
VRGNDSGGVAGVFTSTNSNVSTAWSDNTAVGGLGAGTAGNGTGDGEDLYLATGVTATFNVATGLTQNFSTATNTKSIAGAGRVVKAQLGTLIFSAQNTYSGGTTLTAGFLTLGDNASLGTGPLSMGGGILQSNATLTNITNIFTLTAPSSFGGSNSFTMSGTGGLAANALTVNNLAGTITLSGIISDGGLGGSIVKSGAGTLVLSAANSYTGGTVLSAGTLVAGNASALGTGTLNFNGGALQANAPLVLANPYSLTADSVINGSNDLTLSGPGTFGSFNLLVNNSAGTVTLSNSNNGTGSITLDGSILVLSGVNGYTGGTTVTAGTLRLGVSGALAATGAVAVNGGTLDVNGTTQTIGDLSGTVGNITMGGGSLTFGTSTASTTFGGVISQAATLIKQGSGAVLLSGNNSYSGTTRVNAGTLVVGHANALGTSNLELNGGNLQSNSALAITNNYSVTANSAINGSNSLALSGTGALGANILSVLNTAGTVTLSGVLSGVGGSIVQNGVGGTLLISGVGANTYTGGVTLTAGTLIAGKASALGTGALNLNGGTLQTNASLVLANPYSLTANSVINGSNDLTLSGPGTFGNFNLLVNNSAGTVTLSDSISGPGSITLNGNILVLSAVNSYTGGTTVTAGTLQLGVSGALAATGAVAVNGGTLDVNGTTQTISDLSGAAGTITMGGGSLTFGTAVSTTFGGVISETGNLIKQGSGTVILAGNNSFTGTTNINDGILLVNGTLAGPVIVNPGATLGGSGTIGNTVTNNGTVSPGSVLAILTIQGDYNVGANATTNIAINPQGQNARIAVQGTANIDGALTVNAAPGDYVIGTIYTFLTANTVAGTFSSVPTTIGNLKATVVYNAGSTSFELVVSTTNLEPSLSVGNANQRAVGTYIDTLAPVTGSDLAVTLGALAFLSPAQLAHALESISPGRLNASAVLLEDNAVFINKMNGYRLATLRGAANEELQFVEPTFNNRLQAYKPAMLQSKRAARQTSNFIKPSSFNSTKHGQLADTKQNFATQSFSSYDERSTIWVNPFGRYSNTSANDIDPRFNATTAGFAVGMDHKYANDFIVGISVGRYQSSINLIAFPDHMNVNTNFATLYGTWFRNGYYAEVSVVGGLPTYYSNHNIAYSGINRTSVGKHHGASIAPHLGIGKAFNFRTIMLTPYVSVDYIYISEQGYLLTGANSLDMDIQPKTANALYSEAGMKFSKTYVYADKLITPEVELSYTYVDAHNGNMAVSLLGQPGGFNVVNFSGSSYYVSPTIGILVKTISGGFVKAFFTSDFGSDYQAYEVSIRAGIAF